MNAAFIVAAIVGGGLVLASLFGALGDHDVGSDAPGSNIDHVGHLDHASGDFHAFHEWSALTILSARFWVYTIAGFGLIGVLLSALRVGSNAARLTAAIIGGVLAGLLVQVLFRTASTHAAGTDASARNFVGVSGRVSVSLRSGAPGKVRLQHQGQTIELLATADASTTLAVGDDVLVVSLDGPHAVVVPLPQPNSANSDQVGRS